MKKVKLQRKCPLCDMGSILINTACPTCKGKSLLIKDRMPIDCPNPQCEWGAVEYQERCLNCDGTGWI